MRQKATHHIVNFLIALIIFIIRNFFLQFSYWLLVIVSGVLGVLILLLPRGRRKEVGLISFIILALPFGHFIFKFLVSAIPFGVSVVIAHNKKYYLLLIHLILVPLVIALQWCLMVEKSTHSIEYNTSNLVNLETFHGSIQKRDFSKDTIYFLSFWHIGCYKCLEQEKALLHFKNNVRGPYKILSIESRNDTATSVQTFGDEHHSNFALYRDKSAVLREMGFNGNPKLLIFRGGGKTAYLSYGFGGDTFKEYFLRYYWQWKASSL